MHYYRFTLLLLAAVNSAQAVVFDVDTTADVIDAFDGFTSLREAVVMANTNVDVDTINLPAGIYTLTITNVGGAEDASLTGDLDINGSAVLAGQGATNTIIDAAGLDRICYVQANADVTFSDLTLRGGNADNNGGGIYNDGTSRFVRCQVEQNYAPNFGGGIHVVKGRLFVNDSTFAYNVAPGGAGIDVNSGTIVISNSTISGNYAFEGAGLFRDLGQVNIYHSTIASNRALSRGGGILTSGEGGNVAMGHTLVAGNTSPNAPNVFGPIGSLGFNWIGSNTGTPVFAPLAFNGGPTRTHALPNDSPAVNAGDPAFANGTAFDQRGPGFPRKRGMRVDIGAYELQTPDDDADGMLDEEELFADTDPTNAASYMRINSILRTQDMTCVSFTSSTNCLYRLEGAAGPTGEPWFPLGSVVTGEVAHTTLKDSSNLLIRAYRVRVSRP